MSVFVVRTDLALEEGERIRESGVEIHGVILEEETRPETGILVTRVKIETKNGAKIPLPNMSKFDAAMKILDEVLMLNGEK